MGEVTKIAWAHSTFNAWWGCVEVSPECDRCYARDLSKRFGFKIWGSDAERRFFKDKHWDEPLKWNEEAAISGKPWRVFWNSMSDLCEDRRDLDGVRERAWQLQQATPYLTHMLLSKRPQNYQRLFLKGRAPLPNQWFGTTVGIESSIWRAAELVASVKGASVLWVSAEPLLGPLDLTPYLGYNPVHETTIQRGVCIPSGRKWGPRDSGGRNNLEAAETWVGQMEGDNSIASVQASEGRETMQGLPDSRNYDRRKTGKRDGSSSDLSALHGADTGGPDDQPQEWGTKTQQQDVQPGTGQLFGADATRLPDRAKRRAWREESSSKTDESGSGRDSGRIRDRDNDASGDSKEVRRSVPANIEDCTGRPETDAGRGNCGLYVSEETHQCRTRREGKISLVVIGGESGAGCRPMELEWAREIHRECKRTGAAFFAKQVGGWPNKLDNLEDFPEDLRVREFPDGGHNGR